MKTTIIVTALLLGSAFSANAAPLHSHSRAASACIARQQAALAPLYQFVPWAFETNPTLARSRTHCMPVNHNVDWRDFLTPSS